jgi:hypothetical protein
MNALPEKETVIEGRVFVTRMLPTKEGTKLARDVVGIFGPAMFRFAPLKGKDVLSAEVGDVLKEEVKGLMAKLDDATLDRLIPKVMATVYERKGDAALELGATYDVEFRGKGGLFLKILAWAIRAQVQDFWGAFAELMA